MRMKNFTKFGFNDTPGDIVDDMKKNKNSIDPLFFRFSKKMAI